MTDESKYISFYQILSNIRVDLIVCSWITIKGPSLYYVRVKGWLAGWVGGIAKYLLFLTGVGGWSGKGQKHPYVI